VTARELAEGELRSLVVEIEDARARLDRLAAEIAALDTGPTAAPDRATLALIAVDLHSYYTILESLIERIVMALEGRLPPGPATHTELLRCAVRPLPGVRPAILDGSATDALDELRRFRHFFRHAYALDLRFDKLRRALDPFRTLHGTVSGDLARFTTFLTQLTEELARV